MAILDTLIAQSARLGHPPPLLREQDAAAFRQEIMGALALFTGGRSLIRPDQTEADTQDFHVAVSPIPAMTPVPEPPDRQKNTAPVERTSMSRETPDRMTSRPATQAARDWSTLLTRTDHITRQALKEVEPTLHNAEQSLSRFIRLQTRQHDETRPEADPATILQGFSAMMTARSILGLHAPGGRSSAHDTPGRQAVTPHRPVMTFPPAASLHPGNDVQPPERNVFSPQQENRLTRLSLTLTHAGQALSRMIPDHDPAFSPSIPDRARPEQPFSHLVQHVEAASPPRQVKTHKTTTHSPTIHITVQAGQGRPQDIARAVEASTINALTRQTLTRTG